MKKNTVLKVALVMVGLVRNSMMCASSDQASTGFQPRKRLALSTQREITKKALDRHEKKSAQQAKELEEIKKLLANTKQLLESSLNQLATEKAAQQKATSLTQELWLAHNTVCLVTQEAELARQEARAHAKRADCLENELIKERRNCDVWSAAFSRMSHLADDSEQRLAATLNTPGVRKLVNKEREKQESTRKSELKKLAEKRKKENGRDTDTIVAISPIKRLANVFTKSSPVTPPDFDSIEQ